MLSGRGRAQSVCAGLLLLWCALFLHTRTTEQSMIRAVMLERGAEGWTAGLVYQAPEGSADSSEAQAEVRFAAAEGETLAYALAGAEALLPEEANYRLCDYLLLAPGADLALLDEYETLVLDSQCGRVSARVLRCGFDCAELSEQSEEADALPEKLLQCVKDAAPAAPCLYTRQSGLVLPQLELTEEALRAADAGVFLSGAGEQPLDAAQTAAIRLMTGAGGTPVPFWLDGARCAVRCRSRAVTPEQGGGFVLRLDCQTAAGAQPLTAQQTAELAALCTQAVQDFWAKGVDLMQLRPAAALRQGPGAGPDPERDACPPLRTEVRSVFDF